MQAAEKVDGVRPTEENTYYSGRGVQESLGKKRIQPLFKRE